MDNDYQPTKDDIQFLNDIDHGYIGIDKPKVIHTSEAFDYKGWKRYKAAQKLGVPESELPDEPDDDASSAFEAWA